MSSRETVLNQLKTLKAQLKQRYPIANMALFGSYARNEFTEQSDIDVLIEFNGKVGSRFIELADEIEVFVGKKVDLVSMHGIRPQYFKSIERELVYV